MSTYLPPDQPDRPVDPQPATAAVFQPEPAPGSNRTAIIAGVVTALGVLAVLGYIILSNQTDPAPPIPTTVARAPITTLSPSTTTTTSGTAVTAGYTPTFESGRCRFSLITDVEHECGWLVVPEDRQNPGNGREVRLHVARFSSKASDPPDDPIVYLDGGPGGSTLDPLQFTFAQLWEPLLDDRDLILFDQRGVGLSTPSLDCPEERAWSFSVLDQDLTPEQERADELAAIEQCRDRLVDEGVDLAQYNSSENAADVADLRLALGIEEWNLLGISYGTRLAETVMRDHPAGVRSVVLDSTYTPDVNLISEGPANFDRALGKLWDGCSLDADCAARYPNLEDRMFAVAAKMEAEPIRASVRDFLNGGSWDVLFDGEWVLGSVFQGLYSEQVIPLLPQMIEELEQGETSTLSLLTSNTLANADFLSLGMHLSVQCNEEVTFTTQDQIDAGLVGFDDLFDTFDGASNLGDFMLAACEVWQAGAAAPIENEPVVSDIPTLILSGEYDPITPPAWGASAAAYLTNSTYVEFPGLGHGTSVSGDCPLGITFAFIGDPAARPDVSCVDGMRPIDFAIPGEAAAALVLVPFSEDVLGTQVSGVVPEGWTSVGFGAYARADSAIDQTAVLQQVAPRVRPEELVSLFTRNFGMTAEPERTSTQDSALGTWQLYRGDADGFSIDIAAIDLGGSSAVIVIISDPADRSQLLGDLMLPAIDAFRAG